MKAVLATKIGRSALGHYDSKCSKAPVDTTNIRGQGRHQKRFIGEMNYQVVMDGPWLCDHCGEEFMPDCSDTIYDTPSGYLEPGNLYWDDSMPENYYWDNHKGPMLHAVVPTGAHWNIDSRASNCTMKDDRTHRCWVRSGSVPNIHVSKDGHTCQAGAGSIWANQGSDQEWHGYLHNGQFHQ